MKKKEIDFVAEAEEIISRFINGVQTQTPFVNPANTHVQTGMLCDLCIVGKCTKKNAPLKKRVCRNCFVEFKCRKFDKANVEKALYGLAVVFSLAAVVIGLTLW